MLNTAARLETILLLPLLFPVLPCFHHVAATTATTTAPAAAKNTSRNITSKEDFIEEIGESGTVDLEKLIKHIEAANPGLPKIQSLDGKDIDELDDDDKLDGKLRQHIAAMVERGDSDDDLSSNKLTNNLILDEKDSAILYHKKVLTPPRRAGSITNTYTNAKKYFQGVQQPTQVHKNDSTLKVAKGSTNSNKHQGNGVFKIGVIKGIIAKRSTNGPAMVKKEQLLTKIKPRPGGEKNRPANKKMQSSPIIAEQRKMDWNNFQRFNTIDTWLDVLTRNQSYRAFARKLVIGQTFEKRNLSVVEINTKNATDVFWIDGGIHAREWASPAVVTYLIKELVENYQKHKDLVDAFRWFIMPVHNPDGYEYSHTQDRMWRKNRSKRSGKCVGVDLNRNWNFHWGVGASTNPCSEVYGGPKPETEESIIAVKNLILGIKSKVPGGRVAAFYTFHSSGSTWLTPWGWTRQDAPRNDRLVEVAKVAVDALYKRHGTRYRIFKAIHYGAASGASDDWAYGVAKVPFVYTIELPAYGGQFLMPPSRILPTGQETFEAVKASAFKIKETLSNEDERNAKSIGPPLTELQQIVWG